MDRNELWQHFQVFLGILFVILVFFLGAYIDKQHEEKSRGKMQEIQEIFCVEKGYAGSFWDRSLCGERSFFCVTDEGEMMRFVSLIN